MTAPINPIRPSTRPRKAARPSFGLRQGGDDLASDRTLPVVLSGASAPEPEHLSDGASVFSAQLMGQDGQKRGLRGGPPVLDAARTAYVTTEYSGPADRRSRKGGAAKTEI